MKTSFPKKKILGGPIYFKCQNNPSQFTFTVKGAVIYAHYTHGYTTPDEFSENWKSTAPYFDLEVWQGGILHSGPRFSVGSITDYEDFYQAGCYWEKATSVSNQVPSSGPAKTNVNMMYECFIAAGGAVAFVRKGATNCPMYWTDQATLGAHIMNITIIFKTDGDWMTMVKHQITQSLLFHTVSSQRSLKEELKIMNLMAMDGTLTHLHRGH